MAQNIFEELHNKKLNLISLVKKAKDFKWFDVKDDKKNAQLADEIIEKINNDVLIIGVIGQMKCGKSTFLNAFVFEDDVLPSATTPMTAALSFITYGENKKVKATFYSSNEWDEMLTQSQRDESSVSSNEKELAKIRAAKELVEKSAKLGSSLKSYLGTTKEDDLSKLEDYVGADGKFVSITKSVEISYPKEYLKGVQIVDTPGFNDPIVSREERTKEFLQKADVVLMMLYAGRPFDATDRTILFENVRERGTGKILVGINKYDIPYETGETEDEIKEYVKEEFRKASRACKDDIFRKLITESEPIPLSAEMALLSELDMSKISNKEEYQFAWKRHCETFEISNQKQFREKSHIDDLISAVKTVVNTEKEKILFTKPLAAILSAGEKVKADNEKELAKVVTELSNLNTPDDELDEKEENLAKANKRFNKKIDALGEDIESEFSDLVKKGKNDLEDVFDASIKKIHSIIDSLGTFQSMSDLWPEIESELKDLVSRKLKRETERINDDGVKKVKNSIYSFFDDAENILMKYLPDFDSDDFIKSTKNKIKMDMESTDLFDYEADNSEDYGFFDGVVDFLNGYTLGVFKGIGNWLSHNDQIRDAKNAINEISCKFDPEPYLSHAFDSKDKVIEMIKQQFLTELIEPLQEQLKDIKADKANKVKNIEKAEARKKELETIKATISKQLEEVDKMKNQL